MKSYSGLKMDDDFQAVNEFARAGFLTQPSLSSDHREQWKV